jgi:hypothetical protein
MKNAEPPTNRPHRVQTACRGAKKILSPRLQPPEPQQNAQGIWRHQPILALIAHLARIADRRLTSLPSRATTPPPTNRPRPARQTAHAEHRNAERDTSSPEYADKPRDSAEKLDSHRQNHAVESGVTKEHINTKRDVSCSLTPRPSSPKPPYAYRTKTWGPRDVLCSGSTPWIGLRRSSGSNLATFFPYTRRAESANGAEPSRGSRRTSRTQKRRARCRGQR